MAQARNEGEKTQTPRREGHLTPKRTALKGKPTPHPIPNSPNHETTHHPSRPSPGRRVFQADGHTPGTAISIPQARAEAALQGELRHLKLPDLNPAGAGRGSPHLNIHQPDPPATSPRRHQIGRSCRPKVPAETNPNSGWLRLKINQCPPAERTGPANRRSSTPRPIPRQDFADHHFVRRSHHPQKNQPAPQARRLPAKTGLKDGVKTLEQGPCTFSVIHFSKSASEPTPWLSASA